MPIDFDDDLDEMLSDDDHGTIIKIGSKTIKGIFNNEYYQQELGTAGVASSEPVVYVSEDDCKDLSISDAVTVETTAYTVAHIEPDGKGLMRVILNA